MNHRERLLRALRFERVDRAPDYEFGAWPQTIERWKQEGMEAPAVVSDGPLERFFGTDDAEFGPQIAANVGLCPAFETIIIEDRGTNQIVRNSDGAIVEQIKPQYGASIPRYLRHAIETREDWTRLRDERLAAGHPDRLPPFLDALARRLKHTDYPLTIHYGSLYGWPRNWIGVENLSYLLHDNLPLVEEIMEHLTELTLSVLQLLAGKLRFDLGVWSENMAYNRGPMISPRLFRNLVRPRHKRIVDFARRELGVAFNMLDCDGNIHALAPLWLDSGITVMFPVEAAHTEAGRLAQEHGTKIALRGAFDKRALLGGPAAIGAEFERLRPLLARGGFIPHLDHRVPPEVSLDTYTCYRRRKCEFIGKPWREPGIAPQPGYLTDWLLLGPFDNTDNRGFQSVLPPESNTFEDVTLDIPFTGKGAG